jgi:5-methylcytosine-specific restriction endonuclease McrA
MVGTRSGKYYAMVYDRSTRKRRWLGTFEDFESARAAEIAAKGTSQQRSPSATAGFISRWSLAAKGEMCCRNCGDQAGYLHHIVPRAAGGTDELENALPLCDPCHRGWHSLKKTITRDKLTDAEIAYVVLRRGATWLDRFYPRGTDRRYAKAINEVDALRTENRELRAELAALRSQLIRIRGIAGEGTSPDSRGAT